MNLTEIRAALDARGLRPQRAFGQNFLHDRNLCRLLAEIIARPLAPGAPILEIGPGLGALTAALLEQSLAVTAIEIDRGLAAFLRERFASQIGAGQFVLHQDDALRVWPSIWSQANPPFAALAGNLPYNISTPLIMDLLQADPPVPWLVFTLQKEVAERLAAPPRTKAYGQATVLVQAEYDVHIERILPASVFYPAPEVTSCFVTLSRKPSALLSAPERRHLHRVVKTGFSQRRKKLSNLLPVADSRRPDQLSVDEWIELARELAGFSE